MPLAALGTYTLTFLVLHRASADQFGAITLLSTFFQLLPFTDLGVGGVVINAVARPKSSEPTATVVASAFRLLRRVSLAVSLAAVGLFAIGAWPVLLGSRSLVSISHGSLVMTLSMIIFAVSIPFSLGQRILVGLGRNDLTVWFGLVMQASALTWTVAIVIFRLPIEMFALGLPIGLALCNFVTFAVAVRRLDMRLGSFISWRIGVRRFRAVSLRSSAAPMLIIMLAGPIAFQADRLILSHRTGPGVLAIYSLAAQLYLPLSSLVTVGAQAVWPLIAADDNLDVRVKRKRILSVIGMFVALGTFLGVALVLGGGLLSSFVSGSKVVVPDGVWLAFAGLLVAQSLQLPAGNALTRPRELRFQAACIVPMMIVNVALSYWWALPLGAAGPIVASTVALTLLQGIPYLFVIMRGAPVSAEHALATGSSQGRQTGRHRSSLDL